MQIVVAVSYFNNKKVLKTATKAWEGYFPGIDFKMILSSGATPYADFKKYYEAALTDGLEEDALKERMKEAFNQMETENVNLVEAMKKSLGNSQRENSSAENVDADLQIGKSRSST